MSKIAQYLQEHLLGEVSYSPEARKHFAVDASILRRVPEVIVYPRNENDVRKAARFAWQLAERGRVLPLTARGGGSDTSGGAIGGGILLVFTAHMNRVLTLDSKKEYVSVEPGLTYDKLEQTLYTHGLFLPPYPASKHYATIGGGLANNTIGEKSVKYGTMADYAQDLRVVLANGEVIETGRLGKRELNRKLGLTTFEGEIYRALDTLLEDNSELIAQVSDHIQATRNAAGYNLYDVKNGGGFDLTPLFVGSKGTLGIITEASLEVVRHNPITKTALVSLENLNDLNGLLPKILALNPSICDMVNKAAVQQVTQLNPNQLAGLMEHPNAAIHLFIEFDDTKDAKQKKSLNSLTKLVEKVGGTIQKAQNPDDQDRLRKIRESVSTIMTQPHGQSKAVPLAEDICVPVESLVEYLHKAAEIYRSAGLIPAAWGHAGDGVVRMQPMLDLGQVGDRQKLTRLASVLYSAVVKLGGTTTAAAGDGRVRAPYNQLVYGPEMHDLMLRVKKIFDPHGILNPGVKTASEKEVMEMMRGEYSLAHRHEHLPRS